MKKVSAPAGLGIGALGGLVGIGCCVSPIVLYLVGVASATEAVGLATRWYGEYGWYFRGAGLLVGGVAFAVYLRSRRQCDLSGARTQWRTVAIAAVAGIATYGALYGLTTWLGTFAHA